jgi:hypothetical protein
MNKIQCFGCLQKNNIARVPRRRHVVLELYTLSVSVSVYY